jgi:hypothetical protein
MEIVSLDSIRVEDEDYFVVDRDGVYRMVVCRRPLRIIPHTPNTVFSITGHKHNLSSGLITYAFVVNGKPINCRSKRSRSHYLISVRKPDY